jgi:hypothetical protein
MKRFSVYSPTTFHWFGYFDAETQEDALDQAAREAGYTSYAAVAKAGFDAVADEVADD